MCTGPYEIEHVSSTRTRCIPTMFRGCLSRFRGPQGAFAAECQLNKLAERLGLDPVEIRRRNVLHDGGMLSVGSRCRRGNDWQGRRDLCQAGGVETRPEGVASRGGARLRATSAPGDGFACAFRTSAFPSARPSSAWRRSNCAAAPRLNRRSSITPRQRSGRGAYRAGANAAHALGIPSSGLDWWPPTLP